MVSEGIFLVRNDTEFLEMRAAPYDSEELLQRLLSAFPGLIAGDQLNSDVPRRWVLIAREQSVPGEEGGSGRWSLDHLLVDQDAVPTLVEVKRASDTRARREVVAQMLDYAANGVVYWPAEELRLQFERTCAASGQDAQDVVAQLIGPEADPEGFWRQVDINLRAGNIRMIFVADVIHPELRRIVEFLNSQMNPAEVLALEIRQFVADGMRTLVPRLVGQTAEASLRKKVDRVQPATVEQWLSSMRLRHDPQDIEVARSILDWLQRHMDRVATTSAKDPAIFASVTRQGEQRYIANLKPSGKVVTSLGWLSGKPPFDDEALRREVLRRLEESFGIRFEQSALNGSPGIPLSMLRQPGERDQLFAIWDWIIAACRS